MAINKSHIKAVLYTLGILLIVGGLIFSNYYYNNQYVKALHISILDKEQYQFVTKKEIENIIENYGKDRVTKKMVKEINLNELETSLDRISFLKSANAYINVKGELFIDVTQRVPLARIYNPSGDTYYMDEDGVTMPISLNHTPKLPVLTCMYVKPLNLYEKKAFNKQIYPLLKAIHTDTFVCALTGQIVMDSKSEFEIIPILGSASILIGDTSMMESKMKRVRKIYTDILPYNPQNTYQSFSVKFKNQIIAKK